MVMDALTQKVYDELGWFTGRQVELSSVLLSENYMERYHKGKAQITLFKSRGQDFSVDIIDIEVIQDGYRGVTLEATLLKHYETDCKYVDGFMQKTLTIHLNDDSVISLTYQEAENDLTDPTDIELSEAYVRYLLHLPLN